MKKSRSLSASLRSLRDFGQLFGPHLKPQYPLIRAGLGALLFGALVRLLEPWPLKFVIDRLTGRHLDSARVSLDWLNAQSAGTLLLLCALALVLVTVLRALLSYTMSVSFALAGNRTMLSVRSALFRHVQRLSPRYYTSARGGDLVLRMAGDVGMVQDIAATALMPLLGNLLVLLGMFVVMLWLDPVLALIASAVLPVLLLATWWRGKRIHQAAGKTRHSEGALASAASESIGAIRTIQTLGLDRHFNQHFDAHGARGLTEGVKVKKLSAGLERLVDALVAVSTAAILFVGGGSVS